MGTYTELVLKCTIRDDIPEIVNEILTFLFCERLKRPCELPNHPFFKNKSWEAIGRSASYYHIPIPSSFYNGKYLFSRSDLKNYHDEIQSFLDWLKPYLSTPPGKFIGWIFAEEMNEPVFIYNDSICQDEEDLFKKWDNYAKESLVDCTKVFIEEGHKKHVYEFAETCIHNSIIYLNRKRASKGKEGCD